MTPPTTHWLRALLVSAGALAASIALAQTYPSKPVRLVSPYAAGGSNDFVTRAVGERLAAALGQPFLVENKPGAATILANDMVAKAPADGYTLLMCALPISTAPALMAKVPYDALKDLAPITLTARLPAFLVVNPAVLDVNSVKEVVAAAKARPGALSYAGAGSGSALHLAMELLKQTAGIDLQYIPFKGSAPATAAVLGGQLPLMFETLGLAQPHQKTGKLRILATTAAQRVAEAPEIPTFREVGYPEVVAYAWFGLMAPAGTPQAIIETLNRETVRILRDPDVAKRFATQGVEPAPTTPAEFGAFLRSETEKWGKVIRTAGIKAD